jgi:hypothetical protein
MVDAIRNLCHKPSRKIYGIQMAWKKYKLYGSRSQNIPLKELTNLTLLPRTSLPNIQKQIQNQDESPQGKTNSSGIALRTKHSSKGRQCYRYKGLKANK